MSSPRSLPILNGQPAPLGATFEGDGVNFALYAANADRVDLCLFDDAGKVERARITLPARSGDIWHGFVPGLAPGSLYGYRVHGPYSPDEGHRFNPNKLLVDPYARTLHGRLVNDDANFGFDRTNPEADLSFDSRDNAVFMPKCVVVGDELPLETATAPLTPWRDTILYELHVAGMTRRHPGVPEPLRGTFAGLASEPVIGHLRALGISAVELLPVFPFADEPHLVDKGLTNYWGYNPYCFLAPDPRYAAGPARAEMRDMVRRFHDANIEVVLDVVYNHTGEGWHLGPTLSLRGIDNRSYYRLRPDAPRYYIDDTGCGNTLALDRKPVLDLVIASLRHWVEEFGVDGFRFDLATTLARTDQGFDGSAPLIREISADPVLARVKLIAEPWDVGPGGYRLGGFPNRFSEWNDRYRNAVRSFWRGDHGRLGELATRITASADIFHRHSLGPEASLNYVTAHDGFSLRDLVSYERKHNEDNGEENRDGTDDNLSANHGIEGPTGDPSISETRQRQVRNIIATLLFSQGVPMLLAGDEVDHTQRGNNNAYAQNNEITWIDWSALDTSEGRALFDFVRKAIELRKALPELRQKRFLQGTPRAGETLEDASWWSPEGRRMTPADWQLGYARSIGLHLAATTASHEQPEPLREDAHLLILFNAHDGEVPFRLPPAEYGSSWRLRVDTAVTSNSEGPRSFAATEVYPLAPRSLVLLGAATDDRDFSEPATGITTLTVTRPRDTEPLTLDRLCNAAGIELSYWDLKGQERKASADTKRALLGAMGIAATTEREAQDTLRTLDLAPWHRLLPPVAILRQPFDVARWQVEICLPATLTHRNLAWQITLESGELRSGEVSARNLVTTAARRIDGSDRLRLAMPLPPDLPIGKHRFSFAIAGHSAETALIVAPAHCYRPDWMTAGERKWGLACQLYGLRTNDQQKERQDPGIGDFADLADLARHVGRSGGAALGISPAHALFLSAPDRASPYSPSSRSFVNPLFIDIESVPEFADGDTARLSRPGSFATGSDLVDYETVARSKLGALDALFATFDRHHPPGSSSRRRKDFDAYVAEGGKSLEDFATFQALERHLGPPSAWPATYANPDAEMVKQFAAAHATDCRFFAYLQFEADRQLAAAAAAARDSGATIGLYGDLAVGAAPDGAEVWSTPHDFALGCRFGAPPDPFSDTGQDWGMPPINPHRLSSAAYQPFTAMLAASMRHTGALRLDHVMWLERMFWIPAGGTALDGTYVRYPRDDLFAILALESHRHECLIVGEDLGTVPHGFRERMERETILSYRFVRFERFPDGLFRRPETYPRIALATPASHDLATLRGFWLGRDIDAMQQASLITLEQAATMFEDRAKERRQLVAALADQQLLPADFPIDIELSAAAMTALIDAVHRYLARTPSALAMLNIEDLAGVADQSNLPGTIDSYPNWRRRLPLTFDAHNLDQRLNETAAVMSTEGRANFD